VDVNRTITGPTGAVVTYKKVVKQVKNKSCLEYKKPLGEHKETREQAEHTTGLYYNTVNGALYAANNILLGKSTIKSLEKGARVQVALQSYRKLCMPQFLKLCNGKCLISQATGSRFKGGVVKTQYLLTGTVLEFIDFNKALPRYTLSCKTVKQVEYGNNKTRNYINEEDL